MRGGWALCGATATTSCHRRVDTKQLSSSIYFNAADPMHRHLFTSAAADLRLATPLASFALMKRIMPLRSSISCCSIDHATLRH